MTSREYDFDDLKSVMAPARSMIAATLHDTNELAVLPRAIRCNVAGTVALRCIDDTADISITMVAGELLSIRPRYIRATGTTAVIHLII